MTAYSVYRGSPQFSNVLRRDRISRYVGTAGDRAVVIAAPTGCGKTVALADFVSRHEVPCVWVSLGGQVVDYFAILAAVCSTLEDAHDDEGREPRIPDEYIVGESRKVFRKHCSDGAFVVLDDAGFSATEVVEFIERFSADQRHQPIRLLISMRQCGVDDSRVHVIDAAHLAFTDEEARQVAVLLGRADMDPATAEQVASTCCGHPALTSTMLAANNGSSQESRPNPALQLAEQIAADHLDAEERRLFSVMRIVRRATVAQLQALRFEDVASKARKLAECIPLVRMDSARPGSADCLSIHEFLCEQDLAGLSSQRFSAIGVSGVGLLSIMAHNTDAERLSHLATAPCFQEAAAQWLELEPEVALDVVGPAGVLFAIEALPLGRVIRRARMMQLWARVLMDLGRLDDAIAKGRIACRLAEHDDDIDCLASSVAGVTRCLSLAGRPSEAWAFGHDHLAGPAGACESWLRCEQLAALAEAAAIAGEVNDFESVAAMARDCSTGDSAEGLRSIYRMTIARTVLLGASSGDWMTVGNLLAPMLQLPGEADTSLVATARTSMARCLVETGRLLRAKGLVDSMTDGVTAESEASLSVSGLVLCSEGKMADAVNSCEQGVVAAVTSGYDVGAGKGRIALSVVRRVSGDLAGALECAERAYETLSRLQIVGHRSLAAIEVAAVLLAMDDISAARHWVSLASIPEQGRLRYHGLRAAMVIAECDRRDGDSNAGVSSLAPYIDEIRSENSNWQMAMYIRTFPYLLGMLAAAAGASHLPSHMLNMVLPENAERCLRACKSMLDDVEWRLLGNRLMGTERFADFAARKGRPLCRVRLFGGLEVSDGERMVKERDWSKRKGRLLFAMLVIRRGQEVSRESILDHLWPELDEERGKNNFYVAWSSMKAALMPVDERGSNCPYVQSLRGRCRIVPEIVRSDIDDFEELVTKARVAEAEGRAADAIEAYSALQAVYRGDLLPGDVYDDWFTPLREKYRTEFVEAMYRATELMLESGEPSAALTYARRGIDIDPSREDLYQAALRCQIAAGQRSAAIDTFMQCKSLLSEELGLDPSAATITLYERVLVMEEGLRSSYGLPSLPAKKL